MTNNDNFYFVLCNLVLIIYTQYWCWYLYWYLSLMYWYWYSYLFVEYLIQDWFRAYTVVVPTATGIRQTKQSYSVECINAIVQS